MEFDTNKVMSGMLAAFSSSIETDSESLLEYASNAFDDEKQSIEKYAKARIAGEIDDQILNNFLANRKLTLENKILAAQVLSKAAIQKAVNSAINVLEEAIKSAIKI